MSLTPMFAGLLIMVSAIGGMSVQVPTHEAIFSVTSEHKIESKVAFDLTDALASGRVQLRFYGDQMPPDRRDLLFSRISGVIKTYGGALAVNTTGDRPPKVVN